MYGVSNAELGSCECLQKEKHPGNGCEIHYTANCCKLH